MTVGKYKVQEGKVWRITHMPKHEIKSTRLKRAGSGDEQKRDKFQEHFKGRIRYGN